MMFFFDPESPTGRKYDAVLWDFDGVIARTENLHVAAWQRLVTHVEIELPRSFFRAAATDDDRVLIVKIFEKMNVTLTHAQAMLWCQAKQRILESLLAAAPPIYPGVPEAMRQLDQAGIRQGVVTNTWRRNVTTTLQGAGLLDLMQVIIAKEDATMGKPWPECYERAVRRLGLSPMRCLALEDSKTGLASACLAGLGTLAIAHPHSPAAVRDESWAEGTTILSDIRKIMDWI